MTYPSSHCLRLIVFMKVYTYIYINVNCLIFVTSDDRPDTISLSSDSLPESPEFSSWVDDLGLSVADKQTLVDGKWLTATHISAANYLLRSQFPSQNGLQDTCVLKQSGIWSSNPDGFVQIVHISLGHWACLSNKFSPEGSVDLFDSLHTVPEEDDTILPQVCSILHTPEPTITTNVVNVGLQEGGSDCGLFAIAMAYDLCAGVDPVTRMYVQSEMRSHLHSCINNKRLKPFPSTSRNFKERTIFEVRIKVYCKCRMPQGEKWMVCCDRCMVWYHEECVPVPTEVRNDTRNELHWQCPQCEEGTHVHVQTNFF